MTCVLLSPQFYPINSRLHLNPHPIYRTVTVQSRVDSRSDNASVIDARTDSVFVTELVDEIVAKIDDENVDDEPVISLQQQQENEKANLPSESEPVSWELWPANDPGVLVPKVETEEAKVEELPIPQPDFEDTRAALRDVLDEADRVLNGNLLPLCHATFLTGYIDFTNAIIEIFSGIVRHISRGVDDESAILLNLIAKLPKAKQDDPVVLKTASAGQKRPQTLEEQREIFLVNSKNLIEFHLCESITISKMLTIIHCMTIPPKSLDNPNSVHSKIHQLIKTAPKAIRDWGHQDIFRIHYNPPVILFQLNKAETVENVLDAFGELRSDLECGNIRRLSMTFDATHQLCRIMQTLALDLERLLRNVTRCTDKILPLKIRDKLL